MKILVMISTYNGVRFLLSQLESLAAQRDVETWILARDDGSKDDTVKVLRDFAAKHQHVDVREGENKGFAGSFTELMHIAAAEYADKVDLFSFADQDDVWNTDKLARAAVRMEKTVSPALYMSNVMMADEQLRPIREFVVTPEEGRRVAYDFVDAYFLGCTFVFNRALLDLAVGMTRNKLPPSHDRLLYLAARSLGEVFVDRSCTMLYRQHGDNVIGGAKTSSMPVRKRIGRLLRHRSLISDHLVLLKPQIVNMSPNDAAALNALLRAKYSVLARIVLLFMWDKLGFTRDSKYENIKKKLKIMLGFL